MVKLCAARAELSSAEAERRKHMKLIIATVLACLFAVLCSKAGADHNSLMIGVAMILAGGLIGGDE